MKKYEEVQLNSDQNNELETLCQKILRSDKTKLEIFEG